MEQGKVISRVEVLDLNGNPTGKFIETVEIAAKFLNHDFGNPRKISQKKKNELRDSLKNRGDFGSFVIDENNSVIAGNQRHEIIVGDNPEQILLCKRLINYTVAEKRSVNIEDNVHKGEFDVDLMGEWLSDLNLDLGVELDNKPKEEREIKYMELKPYEKYNYIVIAFRSEPEFNSALKLLDLEGKREVVNRFKKSRKLRARVVWADEMPAKLVPREDKQELDVVL